MSAVLADTEGNMPDREPGEEDIRFDDDLPGSTGDYLTAQDEMPEEIAWAQQMSGLPTIIRDVPRPKFTRIGILQIPNAKPGALIGLGAAGLVASAVGGYLLVREAVMVDYSLARAALIGGGLTAAILFLHSAIALVSGLEQLDQKAPA
jgi:hypothetical protein